jgi:dihydropteroate synthase
LLAAFCWQRRQEIIDGLVDLLIQIVHRISVRAEKKVVDELLGDLQKVRGKTTLLFKMAEAALELGVHMVNDVSGLRKEPQLAPLCARYNAGYILMHSKGDPKTMQQDPQYENVIEEIRELFRGQLKQLNNAGVKPVILDPGIGFGKTLAHNLEIVASLDKFTEFGYPLMVGASRKSMIGQILNDRPVHERLTGTIAIHYHCLLKGAKILRVHDVQEAKDSVQVYHAVQAAQP